MSSLIKTIPLTLLILSLLPYPTTSRRAHCFQPLGYKGRSGYIHCPNCHNIQPDAQDSLLGEGGAAVSIPGLEVLPICKDEELNVAQCAHQCRCEGRNLKCREWNGCSAETVRRHCYCQYREESESCYVWTVNSPTLLSGNCHCPEEEVEAEFSVTVNPWPLKSD